MAKDTRRVDILCYRLSLSQKLLSGTEKCRELYEIVDEAVKKLELEVGPITGIPVKMGRGIVNRLSSGPEVQKLCASAVESLDSLLSTNSVHLFPNPSTQGSNLMSPNMIGVENVSPTSLTLVLDPKCLSSEDIVGYTLWHRKAHELEYPAVQTCSLLSPNTKFVVSDLTPATEYVFRVTSYNGNREVSACEARFSTGIVGDEVQKRLMVEISQSPTTNCSSLSNPSSVEDENNNITPYNVANEKQPNNYDYCKDPDKIVAVDASNGAINCTNIETEGALVDSASMLDGKHDVGAGKELLSDVLKLGNENSVETQIIEMNIEDRLTSLARAGLESEPVVGSLEAGLPITPCKLESSKDGLGRVKRAKLSNNDGLDNGSGKEEEPQAGSGSSSKKRGGERQDEEGTRNGPSDKDFEFYVKVIRWLECEGHIEKNFRQKFLTWYSLRANPQEVRIVKVFVDTFLEDPASLAEQLVDTFSDSISSKRSSVVPAGFCMKLWH